MSYLLDTNIISELRKGDRTDRGVMEWFSGIADQDIHLSVLVMGEIRKGIDAIGLRDRQASDALNRWLSSITDNYAGRILPINLEIADVWGRLNIPDPLPTIDGLLAATAIVHDLTLVTRNVRDIARTGAAVFNPFQ